MEHHSARSAGSRALHQSALLVGALFAASAIAGSSPRCPIDDLPMYFSGETRVENGKLLQKWKCPRGHDIWVIRPPG